VTRNTELSRREVEVAVLVAEGLTNKEIAARLSLTISTVKTHVEHALRKCFARNRAHLAAKYRRPYRWLEAPY
jgi:DNA-binding NarL/FixJ family response regulator